MCSYVGEGHDFIHGCPNCGYAGRTPDHQGGFEQVDYPVASRRPRASAPGWVWPLAIGILLLVFLGLVVVYLRL